MKVKHYKVKNKGRFALGIALISAVLVASAVGIYFLFFSVPELTIGEIAYHATNLNTTVVTPVYTGKEPLLYESEDETVFTVDQSGNITVVNGGFANLIISEQKHGLQLKVPINCSVFVTGIDIGSDATLTEGDKSTLKPVITPANSTDQTLTYQSNNPSAATVDSQGVITAVKAGEATITVTNEQSGVSASVKITVKEKPTVSAGSSSAGNGVTEITYINGILIANKTYPLPSSYAPGVQKAALDAFNQMKADAAKEGLNLWIVSGYRSYDYQKQLYNRYVNRDGKAAADTYSARPGHSEHQTGLAFDICSLETSFENTAEGKWLAANAHKYGFILRYPKGKQSVTGYIYEPWHFRYLGVDTATSVYNSGLCLEEHLGITSVYAD